MSTTIIYHRFAAKLPAHHVGQPEDWFFMIEQHGPSNCYEYGSNRRSREWGVVYAGTAEKVMERCISDAAHFDNGNLNWERYRNVITAAQAIRKDRKRLENALSGLEVGGVPFMGKGVSVMFNHNGQSYSISDAAMLREALAANAASFEDAAFAQCAFTARGPRL